MLRVNPQLKLETILTAKAVDTQQQLVVATLPRPILATLPLLILATSWVLVVAVVILHLQPTSQHLESTPPSPRAGLLAQATQELHPHLLIQVTQLVASLEWSIHMCLPLPPQPCHTQFNLVQEWSTKASNNLLDLTQGKTTQVGRTARD